MDGRPRVALVHDWLTGLRGGEKVLEVFCELYPDAEVSTLLHLDGTAGPAIEGRPIRTSFLQRFPALKSHYRWYLPFFPWAIESLRFDRSELIVSSSHCVAKGALKAPGALHICYCHTPMRYIWDRFPDYFGHGLKARFVYGPIARALRSWDVETAERVDHFIANSNYVAERILNYYGRAASAVIHPPVDTEFFTPGGASNDAPRKTGGQLVLVSALVPYKRIDLAVEAFRNRDERLVVVGTGPEERRLKSLAGSNVEFRGRVSDEELRDLYRSSRASLLPGVEDFGIAPVESQACGTPTVAFAQGGALDTVKDGVTGVLFHKHTPEALSTAIDTVLRLRFNKQTLRDWSQEFSRKRFKARIQDFIRSKSERTPNG